jgi:hypothetical protein
VPESIEVDGHVYHTNKILLDSLPADIVRVRVLARRRMEQLKAAKEAQATQKKKRKLVPA